MTRLFNDNKVRMLGQLQGHGEGGAIKQHHRHIQIHLRTGRHTSRKTRRRVGLEKTEKIWKESPGTTGHVLEFCRGEDQISKHLDQGIHDLILVAPVPVLLAVQFHKQDFLPARTRHAQNRFSKYQQHHTGGRQIGWAAMKKGHVQVFFCLDPVCEFLNTLRPGHIEGGAAQLLTVRCKSHIFSQHAPHSK